MCVGAVEQPVSSLGVRNRTALAHKSDCTWATRTPIGTFGRAAAIQAKQVQTLAVQIDVNNKQLGKDHKLPNAPFLRVVASCFSSFLHETPHLAEDEAEHVVVTLPTLQFTKDVLQQQQATITDVKYNRPLMAQQQRKYFGKKTLVLDLDETLLHSSLKPFPGIHIQLPMVLNGTVTTAYVAVRPGARQFLEAIAGHFEVVLFTASLQKYAEALCKHIDPHNVISQKLCRDRCHEIQGLGIVKHLGLLNRPMKDVIMVDNSEDAVRAQPQNAIIVEDFYGFDAAAAGAATTADTDPTKDDELARLAGFLLSIRNVYDVRDHLPQWKSWLQ